MRIAILSATVALLALGCGGKRESTPEEKVVEAYLKKLVEVQEICKDHDEVYAMSLDEVIAQDASMKNTPPGYKVGVMAIGGALGYSCRANPESGSGKHYFVCQDGVVRYSTYGDAGPDSTPID